MHARTISVVFVDIKSVAATNYRLHTHCVVEESDIRCKIRETLGRTLIRLEEF